MHFISIISGVEDKSIPIIFAVCILDLFSVKALLARQQFNMEEGLLN